MSRILHIGSLAEIIRPSDAELEKLAAVGGSCQCGGTCGSCAPPSFRVGPENPFVPGKTAATPVGNLAYTPYIDRDLDRRCLTPLPSAPTTIAAGITTPVVIQPTRGCFKGYYVKVIAVDAANPQNLQRVRVGRVFVGPDCPQDCRDQEMFSDFWQSDDCLGCPLEATFGLTATQDDLRVEITNINAAGSIIAQLTVWGMCLPGMTCSAAYCGN